MDDLPPKRGAHAAKHARNKNAEIDPASLTVKFSPDLKSSLQQVVTAVRKNKHFDGDLLEDLVEFGSGRMSARMVVRLMKDLTQGIEKHTAATGDYRAQDAWQEFTERMIDPPGGKTPFTFVQMQKAREPG